MRFIEVLSQLNNKFGDVIGKNIDSGRDDLNGPYYGAKDLLDVIHAMIQLNPKVCKHEVDDEFISMILGRLKRRSIVWRE